MCPTRTPAAPDDATRLRLVEAAARAIADLGFRGATVREICRRARANVSAVNYHFGSKPALMTEAARWTASRLPPLAPGAGPVTGDPREDLRAVVRTFALRMLDVREEWPTRFMLRALAEPGPAVGLVVREFIEPRVRGIEAVVRPFLPGADARTVRLHALGIVSQVAWHRLAAPVALRLLGETSLSPAVAAEIAEHVVRFTERALAGAAAAAGPAPRAAAAGTTGSAAFDGGPAAPQTPSPAPEAAPAQAKRRGRTGSRARPVAEPEDTP